MQYRITLFFVALLFISCTGSENSTQQDSQKPKTDTETLLAYQNNITTDFLKPHLTAFAHDTMKGRETGTPAEAKAAKYLADEYQKMGLKSVGDNGSYYQHFKLNASINDSVVFELQNTGENQKNIEYRSTSDSSNSAQFVRLFGGTDSLSGGITFAGFGVSDEGNDIDYLSGKDLADKWVMVFQGIPNVIDGDTLINPKIDAQARFQMIMEKGAKGIIVIPAQEPEQYAEVAQKMQGQFGEAGRLSLAYREAENNGSNGFTGGYNMIHPELAAKILELDSVEELGNYRQKLLEEIVEFEPWETGYHLSQIPYTSKETITSKNVLALVEGADPELKDEVVVLTSHYDHVGIGEPDSTGDRIYNGADDDGSGTIGLLNMAKAFSEAEKNGVKPKRSILFLNVSAEEKGLLGSRYYSDHAVFPMEKTIANLNTDMIGRIDSKHEKEGVEKYAYIIGAELISSELDSVIKVANKQSGQIELDKSYNDLNDPNQFYRRSDHWHFGRYQVPFAFFFTGVHEDYHRPSDEVHKIRFDKMTNILKTMYTTTVMLANGENPPAVDNQQFIEITKGDN